MKRILFLLCFLGVMALAEEYVPWQPLESGWYAGSFTVYDDLTDPYERRSAYREEQSLNPVLELARDPAAAAEHFRELVQQGHSLQVRTKEGATVLHEFAKYNRNPDVARVLVDLGADVNARDKKGLTPLHYAAIWSENPEVVRTLIALGARIDARDNYGETPLHSAVTYNPFTPVSMALLELGADPRAEDNLGYSVLSRAVQNSSNPLIVAELIRRVGCEGQACPRVASMSNNLFTLDLLLRRSPDSLPGLRLIREVGGDPFVLFRDEDKTPLDGLLRTLCRYGVNLQAKDKSGLTPSQTIQTISQRIFDGFDRTAYRLITNPASCNESKHPQADLATGVKVLDPVLVLDGLQHGARPKGLPRLFLPFTEDYFNYTPDTYDGLAILWLLVEYGADIDERDAAGYTALHVLASAVQQGVGHADATLDSAKLLLLEVLGLGADVNARGGRGFTPLQLAMCNRHWPEFATRVLLAHGADPNLYNELGRNALHYWALNNPQPLKKLVTYGLNVKAAVNHADAWGDTPLLLMLRYGQPSLLLDELLAYGPDPQVVDKDGYGAVLMWAAGNSGEDVLERLAGLGVRAVRTDRYGANALHYYLRSVSSSELANHAPMSYDDTAPWLPACEWVPERHNLSAGTLERLVQLGADPTQRDEHGRLPLHYLAAAAKHPLKDFDFARAVSVLAPDKSLINATDLEGFTPLHLALYSRKKALYTELLRRGADPRIKDGFGRDALHLAMDILLRPETKIQLIKLLESYGADVHARDGSGRSLLHHALSSEVADFLLDRGLDVNGRDYLWRTPLHYQNHYFPPGSTAAYKLIERGADVNARDAWGRVPLHYAKSAPLVYLLTARGSRVDARDNEGLTPLFLANWRAAAALLKLGANASARANDGRTPLHRADLDKSTAKLLLAAGADVNARDEWMRTPLHIVDHREVADLLMRAGAKANATDVDGRTPMHMHPMNASTYLEYGADPNARDGNGDTPLHALLKMPKSCYIKYDSAAALLAAGANPQVRNNQGLTPLDLLKKPANVCLASIFEFYGSGGAGAASPAQGAQ
ncbi:ankyrin repeat domain-containing protein [Oceanithermus desulfurans]